MLARQIRAADAQVQLAFGGVFATLNAAAREAAVPRSGLRLPRRRRAAHPRPARAARRSRRGPGPHLGEGRQGRQQPQPHARSQPRSVAVSRSREPAARLRRVDAARRPGRAVDGALHDHADVARLPLAVRLLRHPDLQRGQVALAERRSTSSRSSSICRTHGYGSVYFVDDHFLLQPKRIEAICKGITDAGVTIQWGCEGRVDSVAQHLFPAMAKAHCRTIMFGIESGSQKVLDRLKKEQTLAEVEIGGRPTPRMPASRSCTASSSSARPTRPSRTCAPPSTSRRRLRLDTFGSTACASIAARRSGTST